VLAAAIAAAVALIVSRSASGDGASSAATAASGGPSASSATTDRRRHQGTAASRADRQEAAVMRYTPFIANGTHRRRAIALTFDDGPSPYTPEIIHVLLRMHVPATFFVVGQELHDFAGALRSEIRHGFVIGDHTQNHAWLIRLGARGQVGQIGSVAHELEHDGAPAPRLFRPPYGAFNAVTMATLRRLRMLMVLWSIDPSDWRRPGTRAIVSNVLANSRPGAIVIMHDGGGDRSQTVAALPAIINGLRKRHYGLVTVPRLLALDPPPRHQRAPHLSGV
jgi:peptidoglycan/xylan/chitin deacetylase (PgdA/CDA1 family)